MAFSGRGAAALLALAVALGAADPPEYTDAIRLVQQQNWQAAHQRIGQLLTQYPGNTKVLNLQGLAFLGEGKSQEAIAAFERALDIDPRFFPALKNLTILEWTVDRQPAARDHLQAALKMEPGDAVLNVFAGLAALERKDYTAASNHLGAGKDRIQALDPAIEFRLATLLASNERHAEAARHFESLIARGADSYNVRYNLGLCYLLARDHGSAIRVLDDLRSRRKTSEVNNLLARVHRVERRTEKAVELLSEAVALDPAEETNYLDLSILWLERGAHEKALEAVEAGLRVAPRGQRLYFQRGMLNSLMNRFAAAESDFEMAGRLAPESQLPAAGVSLTAIQRSELPAAIAKLRESIRRQGDGAVLRYLLGLALIRNGAGPGEPELGEAESAFEAGIKLDPKYPHSYIELAKIYLRTGRAQQAVPLLEKASELAPDERSVYAQLAVAYRRSGQQEKAGKMIEAVKRLNDAERGVKTDR